ncbi:branched-chain amino acid ABC transporter permease [Fundidesulfovibrio butyratiphilus]
MLTRLTVPVSLAALLVLLVTLAQTGLLGQYGLTFLCTMGIYIILSASLNLVNGYMGEFSCGHAGFMAVGAYVTSVLGVWVFVPDKVFGQPFLPVQYALLGYPVLLLAGFVAAALAGVVVAVPSFKTRGDYLAVITLAAGYIIKSAIQNIEAVGGPRGFMGMGKMVEGMNAVANLPWMLIWIFACVVFTLWFLRRFVYSTYGKGVMAISQDEVAAEIMSVNTNKMKLIAFMVSSGLAGVAGGLYAFLISYIDPKTFSIELSTACLLMVYLGGMGSLTGSVLSAALYCVLLEFLKPVLDFLHVPQTLKWVVIPMGLILLMQFRPEGIMGNRELSDVFPKLKRAYRFK